MAIFIKNKRVVESHPRGEGVRFFTAPPPRLRMTKVKDRKSLIEVPAAI
jgi:hypothetical protein